MEFSRLLFAAFFVWAAPASLSHPGELVFSAPVNGVEVRYRITTELINATPKWPDSEDSPPVVARKAIRIATAMLPEVIGKTTGKRGDRAEWEIDSACLKQFAGRWYWVVSFNRVPADGTFMTGIQDESRIVILMDGQVVLPIGVNER